jgi:hypothetical protein
VIGKLLSHGLLSIFFIFVYAGGMRLPGAESILALLSELHTILPSRYSILFIFYRFVRQPGSRVASIDYRYEHC